MLYPTPRSGQTDYARGMPQWRSPLVIHNWQHRKLHWIHIYSYAHFHQWNYITCSSVILSITSQFGRCIGILQIIWNLIWSNNIEEKFLHCISNYPKQLMQEITARLSRKSNWRLVEHPWCDKKIRQFWLCNIYKTGFYKHRHKNLHPTQVREWGKHEKLT